MNIKQALAVGHLQQFFTVEMNPPRVLFATITRLPPYQSMG